MTLPGPGQQENAAGASMLPDVPHPLPAATSSLPATASETSPERPWPVRHLSPKIGDYIAKMSPVWVEGQALNVKRWKHLVFLTLRDTDENMSLRATIPAAEADALPIPLEDGARVVIQARPQWWVKSGDLQMVGTAVRSVGVGDLLARIEALKAALAAEGLFAAERKVPLPFLPRVVGLVVATQGDAEHDVVHNATLRWPAVRFEIRRVTVQGPKAVPEVVAAVRQLDAMAHVDVIVIARGGGSLEDLLPFSDEAMVRAIAQIETPVVSAIGHELDSPLLDLVADLRASTPTDAAKRIVPDAALERDRIAGALALVRAATIGHLTRGRVFLEGARSRPVMAEPLRMITPHRDRLELHRKSLRQATTARLSAARAIINAHGAALRALSPQSTLDRGYAVVRGANGAILREAAGVAVGDAVDVRLARGSLTATVSDIVVGTAAGQTALTD